MFEQDFIIIDFSENSFNDSGDSLDVIIREQITNLNNKNRRVVNLTTINYKHDKFDMIKLLIIHEPANLF